MSESNSGSNSGSSPDPLPEPAPDAGRTRSFGSGSSSQASLSASQLQLQVCDPRAAIGKTICKDYEIRDIIGEGGMAVVYKVRKISTGEIVAGKTLRFVEKALTERFLREIEIHTKLQHKNIVRPVEFAMTATGQAFFFMELLSGTSLEDLFSRHGRIRRGSDIADILIQVCEALTHAHSKGIVHRDIKPGNVIVNMGKTETTVKVVDFGLAKLNEDLQRITKTGQVLGSPVYMSPEQCMGLTLDPRSDVYSLGILAYEMVTGVLPYDGNSPVALMEQHCNPDKIPIPVQQRRPELAGAVEMNMIIRRAIESEPENRYQSAAEMQKALESWRALVLEGTDGGHFDAPEYDDYRDCAEESQVEQAAEALPVSSPFGSASSTDLVSELKSILESPDNPDIEPYVPEPEPEPEPEPVAPPPPPPPPPPEPEPVPVKEERFDQGSLRDLVSQRQDSEVQKRTERFYSNESFVSEQTPASAQFGEVALKVLVFLVVAGGACALTLYLIVTFIGEP